jgi:LysR family glycine cleavage system transcriptional activator
MRRLPPLASLRAFEAAARHLSFKRAAQELAVTPTAISHQVRLLEETLAQPLFERGVRQVRLTPAGRALYPPLREAFDRMADAVGELRRPAAGPPAVALAATLTFTAKWLLPRVAALRARHPDVRLNVVASNDPADLVAGEADVAVRYGAGPWPGCRAERLFEAGFAPVFSPRLALGRREDLRGAPLIHFTWTHPEPDSPLWPAWFARAGLPYEPTAAALAFSDETHALQAAVAGEGVALVNLALVADELAAGALVAPFGPVLRGRPWWLVVPERGRPEIAEPVAAVRTWLLDEAAGFSARLQTLAP